MAYKIDIFCGECGKQFDQAEKNRARSRIHEWGRLLCQSCFRADSRRRGHYNKIPHAYQQLILLKNLGKGICRSCGQLKPLTHFHKSTGGIGYVRKCRQCRPKKKRNENYFRNPDNRCRWNAKAREKYASDPMIRLNSRIRKNIRRTIIDGSKNGRKWEDIVGYTIKQLKHHLSRQFHGGMNWENYGTHWHIDHISPLSSFIFSTPDEIGFKLAWSLKNLRPLEKKENLKKGQRPLTPIQIPLIINAKK